MDSCHGAHAFAITCPLLILTREQSAHLSFVPVKVGSYSGGSDYEVFVFMMLSDMVLIYSNGISNRTHRKCMVS
jgi:hypothetical protein